MSNERRVGKVLLALKDAYCIGNCPTSMEPVESAIKDVLADLRHLCDKYDLDFADLDATAYTHYIHEKHGNDAVPEGVVCTPQMKKFMQVVAKVKLAEGA
jgi:hypothetical protein